MYLVDHPVFFPTTCICGEAHGRMVDTTVERYDERFYLCERCTVAAGRLVGMLPQTDFDAQTVALDDARQTIVDLELEVAELQPVRDALIEAAHRFGDTEQDDEPVRRARKKAA